MQVHPNPLSPTDQALIAAAATRLTRIRFPAINPTGLHQHHRVILPPIIPPHQIATAIEFLDQCRPVRRGTVTSYRLKHLIEAWAGFYISNGAALIAADALEFELTPLGDHDPNALINVSLADLKRLAVLS
jgi:hypothetical protein